jgi:putative intracellular protease/amidase
MNKLSSNLASAVLLSICAAPLAAAAMDTPVAQQLAKEEVKAEITAFDLEKHTLSLKLEGREVTLSYDERTQFMLDGEKSSAERVLAIGRVVNVSHEKGNATKVSAKSK